MNSNRNSNGKYASPWKRRILTTFVILSVATTAAHFTFIGPALDKEISATNEMVQNFIASPIAFADKSMEIKVEDLKNEILNTLAKCESAGKKEEDGIAILDSNDRGSYGPFQFQRKTVMHYMEKKGTPVNGRDAIILALQGDKARELAHYVIFETSAGVANDWVNCNKKHNLQAQVDIIKKLTK